MTTANTKPISSQVLAFMNNPANLWFMREQGVKATRATIKELRADESFERCHQHLDLALALVPNILKACKKQDEATFNLHNDAMNAAFKAATLAIKA